MFHVKLCQVPLCEVVGSSRRRPVRFWRNFLEISARHRYLGKFDRHLKFKKEVASGAIIGIEGGSQPPSNAQIGIGAPYTSSPQHLYENIR
jgi:hypothetical protein